MKKFRIAFTLSCLLSSTAFATTLSEALVHTYNNSPDLNSAREKLKTVDEQMYQAISGLLPRVSFQAAKSYNKQDASQNPFNNQITKLDTWSHSKKKTSQVALQQNLFNGGKTIIAIQIAKYTIESARADLLKKEQDVLINAINAYLDVIKFQQTLEINRENVQAHEKRYEAAKERYEVGIAKRTDLAVAEARRAGAYAQLAKANGDYITSVANYKKIIGLDPENLNFFNASGSMLPSQAEMLQASLKFNPELVSLDFQHKIAQASIKANVSDMLPKVDLTGTLGKNWQDQRNGPKQPYTNTKSIAIEVSIPIYQAGTEYSKIRASSAEATRFKYAVKHIREAVTQLVTQTWNGYIVAQESLKSIENAVQSGQVALEGKQQEYDEGLGTLTQLLDAQDELFSYKIKYASAKQDVEISIYQIYSVMGRLNAKDLVLPTKIYNPSSNYDKVKFRLIGF